MIIEMPDLFTSDGNLLRLVNGKPVTTLLWRPIGSSVRSQRRSPPGTGTAAATQP